MTKKILTIVLSLVLALGCFSAFAEEYEPLSATAVVFGSIGYPPTTDNYGTHYIKDRWNLDLDVLPVDTGTEEDWNTFWIDGYADIIVPYGYSPIVPLLKEEIVRPFPIEWFEEYAPNMWRYLLKQFGTPEGVFEALAYKGEVYCIPYGGYTNGISFISCIRNDWLEALDMDVPQTLDELTALMDAMVNKDPDGNGVNDTYAFDGISYGLPNLAAAFGTSPYLAFWKDADGAVTTNANTEEFKAYISQMAEWYAAGYLDPEYVTDDRAAIRNKYASGKMGIYADNPWWYEYARGDIGPLSMVIANNPEMEYATAFSFFDNVENADGEHFINVSFPNVKGQAAVYFGYDCPDEVIKRMMQLENERVTFYDETEEDNERIKTRAWMDMGPEGENWVWNPDTLTCDPTEFYAEIKADGGKSYVYTQENGLYIFPTSSDMNRKMFEGFPDEFVIELYQWSGSPKKVYQDYNFTAPALSAEGQDRRDLINTCLVNFRNDIIQGHKTIEADWDAYVAELDNLGLQELIAEYESLL